MSAPELHTAQVSILRTLRHAPLARYTTLMQPTGLDSDVFKFHLRKLVHQKYVRKLDSGIYELTPSGKEFANNLSKTARTIQKQPKLSITIIASRQLGATKQYLFQKRHRNPFYGFWGSISGPAQWGEAIELTAQRELQKQTGLAANMTVRAWYRKMDHDAESKSLLEDKLFVVVEATQVRGELSNTWYGGFNAWKTVADLQQETKVFSSTYDFIAMVDAKEGYKTQHAFYDQTEY